MPEQGATEIRGKSVPRGVEQMGSAGYEQWQREYQGIPSIIDGKCKKLTSKLLGKTATSSGDPQHRKDAKTLQHQDWVVSNATSVEKMENCIESQHQGC